MALELKAPMTGKSILMSEVPDEIFATDILGKGVAVDPTDGVVVAPCDGVITAVTSTMHAVCLQTDTGVDILLHIGIDTVKLQGKGLACHVKQGQRVRTGDTLITLDLKACRKKKLLPVSPFIIINPEKHQMECHYGDCCAGETTLITIQ